MRGKRATLLLFSILLLTLTCSKSQTPLPNKSETKVEQKKIESDLELRKQFTSEIEQHLNKQEFDQLESIADKLTKSKDRFPGGDWKIDRFYEVIRPADDSGIKVDWNDRLAKLKKWTDQKPKSIYANIALGCAQIGKAWGIRGSGFADTVSNEQMVDFQKMLKEAETTLNKMSERRKDCPHWYRDMQGVGLGLGYDLETMTKYLEEVTTSEPLYWSAYEGHALYLLPRWNGNNGDWERFAEQASSLNLRGLKYGVSVHYLNAYCILAGGIGDKVTTKALMSRIGDQWEPDLWKEKKYFDGYKKWASE